MSNPQSTYPLRLSIWSRPESLTAPGLTAGPSASSWRRLSLGNSPTSSPAPHKEPYLGFSSSAPIRSRAMRSPWKRESTSNNAPCRCDTSSARRILSRRSSIASRAPPGTSASSSMQSVRTTRISGTRWCTEKADTKDSRKVLGFTMTFAQMVASEPRSEPVGSDPDDAANLN